MPSFNEAIAALTRVLNAHKTGHESGGADEIDLGGLSGDPADTINESLLTTQNDIIVRGASEAERLNIVASRIVARLASGNVVAATPAQIMALLSGAAGADFSMNSNKITSLTDPTAAQDAVTKAHLDQALANLGWRYYLNNTASGIGSYFTMALAPTGEAESTHTSGSLGQGDDQALFEWISDDIVLFDTINVGAIEFHIHAEVTAGNRSVNLYAEIYEYKADTSETLIATSEISDAITSKTGVTIHATLATDYEIASTSKLLIKWLANVGGTGSAVTIVLYCEGTNASRVEAPLSQAALEDLFVLKATYNANTILAAISDDSPVAVSITEQTLLGRITSGNITALSIAQIKTLLGAAAASGLATLNASTKVVEQPASISDHLEGSPTEDLATKAPTSEWAFDLEATVTALDSAVVKKVLFDAQSILAAVNDDDPAAVAIAEQRLVGRITSGNITGLTAAQVLTLIGVDAGADVTGSNPPQAHTHNVGGYSGLLADDQHVLDNEVTAVAIAITTVDAQSLLGGISDNTPVAIAVAEQRLVGRITSGNVTALTAAQVLTLIGVTSGADVTGSNPPQAHKNSHDPQDGGDALDTANAAEISVVVAAGTGTSHSFARADHVHAINHSIANNHIVTIDHATPADNDYAKFTADGLEGRDKTEMLGDLNVADGADVTGSNPPQAHKASHQDNGTDEISVAGLLGETAELATHKANTTTAHGAVSAATASKHVVRDASARAKFAAPGAAGDVLIKGTRHLIAEMPTLTTDKTWKGVGGVPAEVDFPAAGAATMEFFAPATVGTNPNTVLGDYPVKRLSGTSHFAAITFTVPADFSSISNAEVLIIPEHTLAFELTLTSDYAADGESRTTHSESTTDTTSVTANQHYASDISGILSALTAGDRVGITITRGSGGAFANVLGVRFKYS